MTAPLPAYYRDLLRLSTCPSYLDSLCWRTGGSCPFMGGTAYVYHDEIARLLAQCPGDVVAGRSERKSELAYLVLSRRAFAHSGCLGLANPPAKHRLQRSWCKAFLRQLPGLSGLTKEFNDFLSEPAEVAFPEDVSRWWTQILWRHMLQHSLSPEEADSFNSFRDKWSKAAAVLASDLSMARLMFSITDINKEQDSYRQQIQALLPDTVPLDARDDVAQAVLEMLAFAGGISVPQTITACVAALYRDFVPEPITEDNVLQFVYEVTRMFPAVNGFAFWRDGHRHILSLSAGLLDPVVWGKDADVFTLKEVSLYESKHVGFAEQAVADNPDDARACPGKQIALDAAQAFTLAISAWPDKGLGSIWQPKGSIQPGGVASWWKPFKLERLSSKEAARLEEFLQSGGMCVGKLKDLGSVRVQAMLGHIDQDLNGLPDALRKMDGATRIFCLAAKMTWVDSSSIFSVDVPRGPAIGKFTDENSVEMPLAGIRLPKLDEQWTGMSWMKEFGMRALNTLTSFMGDDIADELKISTEREAVAAAMMAHQAFLRPAGGAYLPACIVPWNDLDSDHAQALLATSGPGQLLLRRNAEPGLLEHGELLCDASLLGSLPVRPAFERLGAVAFLKRDSRGVFSVTAIDWKHGNRLVTPSDPDAWKHAKFVWRSSVLTVITLVHHLSWTHWTISNAVASSAREAFGPQHPIRRVLHPTIYNTASINFTTYWTLFPENGFLHHMSPFTYEGLNSAFHAAIEQFRFRTWPQFFAELDLPEELKRSLPIFEDGLPLWSALHDFFAGYVDLYYPSDGAVHGDKDLQAYWRFLCVPQYVKGLPPLSKAALAEQMAQAVFDVTAFHELVGNVIGFISDPRGCFMQVRPGSIMADKQHLIQAMSLAAATGSPMPRFLDDWSWLLDLGPAVPVNHFEEAKALWAKLRDRLIELSAENKRRNLMRPQPFSHFDPEFFESSVSL